MKTTEAQPTTTVEDLIRAMFERKQDEDLRQLRSVNEILTRPVCHKED